MLLLACMDRTISIVAWEISEKFKSRPLMSMLLITWSMIFGKISSDARTVSFRRSIWFSTRILLREYWVSWVNLSSFFFQMLAMTSAIACDLGSSVLS